MQKLDVSIEPMSPQMELFDHGLHELAIGVENAKSGVLVHGKIAGIRLHAPLTHFATHGILQVNHAVVAVGERMSTQSTDKGIGSHGGGARKG